MSIGNIIITLATLLLFSFNSFSLTYTTLADGDWNNTTTVWSLDSVALCGCSPPNVISTHTININDSINLTGTTRLINGAQINISSAGKIYGPTFKVIISSGSIDILGGVLVTVRLDIGVTGNVSVTDGLLEILGQANVYGTLTSINSVVRLGTGNFTVHTGGYASFLDGSYLITNSGNIFIDPDGTLYIDDSCLQAAGNINNEGTVAGVGVVESLLGNVDNDLGVWSLTVDWCVPGFSTNMPLLGNCAYVQGICGGIINTVTLPIELILFETRAEDGNVNVQWVTSNEVNNDHFTIENSVEGSNWNELAIVQGAGNSSNLLSYSYLHDAPFTGVSYYRLKQTDYNGAFVYSDVSSVIIEGNSIVQDLAFLKVYPVPSEGHVTWIICASKAGEYEMRVFDISSRLILTKDVSLIKGVNSLMEDVSSLSNGTYTTILSSRNAEFLDSELMIINK